MPQIFIRTIRSRCASAVRAQRRARIGLAHQRLADQEAAGARARRARARPPDSRCRSRRPARPGIRDPRQRALGRAEVGLEALQIAIVDADELRAGRERALELRLVVHLDQRVEAESARVGEQRASAASESAATISSTASAPAARASSTW